MFVDYHVHLDKADWSMASIEEMVKKADDEGLDRVGIVVHTKGLNGFEPLYYHVLNTEKVHKKLTFDKSLDQYVKLLSDAKSEGYPVDIGIEVCYSPEGEEFLHDKLKEYPFDFVIGSVHLIGNMHYKTAVENFKDISLVGRMYYGLVLNSIESGLFNIIGHIEIARREGIPGLSHFPDMLDEICKALIDNNCAVEINTKWLTRYGYIVPDRDTLVYMADKGVKLVFGSDAHHVNRIGYGIGTASMTIRDAGYKGFSSVSKLLQHE